MGCGASKSYTASPFITETATDLELARAKEAIKKNDIFLWSKMEEKIKLTENYGKTGENLTCLHLACEYESNHVLEKIIKKIQLTFPAKFIPIANIQCRGSLTPAMIAAKNDHVKCFRLLNQYKACDFVITDKSGKTLKHYLEKAPLCKKYYDASTSSAGLGQENPDLALNKENEELLRFDSSRRPQLKAEEILGKIDQKLSAYEILKKSTESNKNFLDPDFPHSVESITIDKSHKSYEVFAKAVWRRPHEFLNVDYDKIRLFDSVDPNDIQQGELGVSYFLSCVSSLAEFPTRLMDHFIIHDCNKYGVYAVRFYNCGVPVEIVVDDYFPCYANDLDKPIFSRAKGNELWVLVIEKAWAKYMKRYIVEPAEHSWALQNLSYAPAQTFLTSSFKMDGLFAALQDADRKNWVITCVCLPDNVEQAQRDGLIDELSYSLLSVHNVYNTKLLKLRNPWGKSEFKGAYSDESEEWTLQMKKEVGFVQNDDGCFFMPLNAFKSNFSCYTISYHQDDWVYWYQKIKKAHNHAEYHEFEIKEITNAYFRVHQPSERTMKSTNPGYKCSSAEVIVCLVNADNTLTDVVLKLDDKASKKTDQNGVAALRKDGNSVTLQPGKYIVRSKVKWNSKNDEDFTLSLYSSKKIELKKPETKVLDFHKRRTLVLVKEKTKKVAIGEGVSSLTDWAHHDLYYFYMHNEGTKTVEVSWNIKNQSNIKLKKNSFVTSGLKFNVKLEPGQTEVVFASLIDANIVTAISHSYEFKVV